MKQVIGRSVVENPYHQNTIRTSLTRNLHARFPEVRDEIACAFDEVLQLQDSGEEISGLQLHHPDGV